MAKIVLTNAHVTVNSVDLSDHVRSVEVEFASDEVEQTTMGDAARNFLPGLLTQRMTVTFANDYASGEVDATISPLVSNGTSHTILVKPVDASVSATNPSYSGTAYCTSFNPVSGAVGDLHEAQAVFVPGTGTGFVRATS